MDNHRNPLISLGATKDNQINTFYEFLKNNIATGSMIEKATNIKQKNITRFKRDLEKEGLLWQVKRLRCQITRRWAWYITTNPKFKPVNYQLNLFEKGRNDGN